jgi:hypothetical protein
MKKLLPCTACQINTVQTVLENGNSICWCGTENEVATAEQVDAEAQRVIAWVGEDELE